jgi:hypothetical protein
MTTLAEVLADPAREGAVVQDSARLIREEVDGKGGLSGMALRAGYKAVCAVKPGIIEEALRHLLPEFAPAIDPHYESARAHGDVPAYFVQHGDSIAESLLRVTDQRSARSKNAAVKRAYDTLRPQAHKHTVEAMPRLARLIARHVK